MDVCVWVEGGLTPYGVARRRRNVSACVLLLSELKGVGGGVPLPARMCAVQIYPRIVFKQIICTM